MPANLQGRTTLVRAINPIRSVDGNYAWWPEYLGVFSIAQPPSRREFYLTMGMDILVFPSGWFVLALEDYSQWSWALQVLKHNWPEVQEWRERFLERPLRHIEPRHLSLVFGKAGMPMFANLQWRRKARAAPYALEFHPDGRVDASVSNISFAGPSRLTTNFLGHLVRTV